MTGGLTVAIDRLACRLTVPAGMARQQHTVDEIVRLAERELPARCSQALVGSPLGRDEAVYRVRLLHVRTWLDAQGMSGEQMAGRWAALLAAALHKELAPTGNPNVVRFDSTRHYLAAFVADLLVGRAWDTWCYDEFRPLARLSPPAATAHLLASRPDWVAGVLGLLHDGGHLDRLVAGWSAADVALVWGALGLADEPGPVAATDHAVVVGLVRRVPLARRPDRSSVARDRMLLWAAAARERPDRARDPGLGRAVARAAEMAALLAHEPEVGPLLSMGSPPYPALARRIATGAAAPALAWLGVPPAGAPRPGQSRAGPGAVAPDRDVAELAAELHVQPRSRASPIGGVALLLPALAAAGVWETWRTAGDEAARRFLYAVLLKGAGRRAAALSLSDGLAAALCGLDAPPVADARLQVDPASAVPPAPASDGAAVAGRDLALAGLGFPWLTDEADAALSAVAAAAIQATARRFPGFANRDPAAFAASFLAQPARLEEDGGRLVMHLGTGLAASLLPLAGLDRPHDVPWLDLAVEYRAGAGARPG